ncbi:HEAT repeat-containing protein [Andreprevotia lacus DSM 23236]|jgi:HEAT repeat protein|uniref:HEAT repeat-containing protein n=1 Tax=Andreprevotia lacus DSM 23236 TaxID=1121001 RepID=A0A1W1Y0C5_9NEIS|nr:HEAT repeat domain-containing protein [Andreprevotia lacus]SMC29669.1 HEAT repeat-containing protein [Andreprevotia lacus DSM 23236]
MDNYLAFKKLGEKSLIGIALQEWDSERSWDAIHELRGRPSLAMQARVECLFVARNWRKRALALDIACQLGAMAGQGKASYAMEWSHALLLRGLNDRHCMVVYAAIFGFGHRPCAQALPGILALASHASAELRYAVAFALGSYFEPESTATLVALCGDVDDDVRNWATFALGALHEADTPEIRACLWRGVDDLHPEVRMEALSGLAKRKDEAVLGKLIAALGDEGCTTGILDAAEQLADARLLPALHGICERIEGDPEIDEYWRRCLQHAVDACSSVSQSGQTA